MTDVNLGDVVEVLDPTRQSNRVPIETLGILRRYAIGPVLKCICRVSVLLFLHPWLFLEMILLPWVVTTFLSS